MKRLSTMRLFPATLAAACFLVIPVAASAGVVVSASGPSAASFPAGKKIGDTERIVLRAGDTVTVLDGKGTRVLRGAGTFTLDQAPGTSKSGTLAVLTERRSAQRVRTGAVRGDGAAGPVQPPNLWYVDVARSGKMCLAESDKVRVWRASTQGDATYTLSSSAGGSETIRFSDGEMLAPWDTAQLPVSADRTYRLSSSGGGSSEISFVVLNPAAEDPEDLAEQLIQNGCTGQLDLLTSATLITDG